MIRLDHVSKVYPNTVKPALNDVSVEIDKGEFVFLVGSSGSGKSTFLRLILKEEAPTSGSVFVAGKDLARLSHWKVPTLRRQIGCVFQDFRLLPNKTVFQNVAFALEVIGKPKHTVNQVVPEVLDLVGLDGKAQRMPDELSGGEQQRVAIARALLSKPDWLFLDEATAALDEPTEEAIYRMLRERLPDTTIVSIGHRSTLAAFHDRRLDLAAGRDGIFSPVDVRAPVPAQ